MKIMSKSDVIDVFLLVSHTNFVLFGNKERKYPYNHVFLHKVYVGGFECGFVIF